MVDTNERTLYMKRIYEAPDAVVGTLETVGAILQASGNFTREDYGKPITDEWGN